MLSGENRWAHPRPRLRSLISAVVLIAVMGLAGCSHSPSARYERIRLSAGSANSGTVHVVAAGDTLAALARHYGVPVSRIARENGIDDPNRLFVGQRLRIPGQAGQGSGNQAMAPGTPGIYHTLAAGETLMSLERAYGVRAGVLKRINNIADERSLRVGQRVFVPGARQTIHSRSQVAGTPNLPYRSKVRTQPAQVAANSAAAQSVPKPAPAPLVRDSETVARPAPTGAGNAPVAPVSANAPAESPASTSGFIHPLAGRGAVSSRFGDRNEGFHYGIDLAAPEGTPIYAVAAGQVEYIGSPKDPLGKSLGNFLMLYHPNSGLRSLYGHCSRVHARLGQNVKRGQVIAEVGHTGRVRGSNGNHLHLEIRNAEGVALDPVLYVPGLR